MKSISHTQLRGRLASEAEFKEVGENKKLLSFKLAYLTPHKADNEGSRTSFILVEIWERAAEIYQAHLKKGMEVLVHGHLTQQRWKNDRGQMRSSFKVTADALSITDVSFKGATENSLVAAA